MPDTTPSPTNTSPSPGKAAETVDQIGDPRRIDDYVRLERIGQGGFGRVFRAFDEKLQRAVAIKLPALNRGAKALSVSLWLTEARVAARLDHPHIVPIYQVGSTAEYPCYLVSKYIEGVNFSQQLKENRLSLRRLVKQIASIADALQHIHSHGLVHRDVKPGNILIDQNDQAWLTDFGIALSDEQVGDGDRPVFVGTANYMSPEQARGEGHRVDGRADVFCLGVVLYETITGHVPFRGTTTWDLFKNICSREVRPPRQYDANLPIEIERICLKALMKRPRDRFQTAAEFAADLQAWLETDVNPETSAISFRPLVNRDELALTPTIAFVEPRLEPKGLRAFDEHDGDFFLELIPGPRSRSGLPESAQEWKNRIESRDEGHTFSVGLVYGPSGCGKTSFIRAGLISQLSCDAVTTIYVEATAAETESRLLTAIRKVRPELPPDLDLVETLAALRRQSTMTMTQGFDTDANSGEVNSSTTKILPVKVLLAIDQFEQWLHVHGGDDDAELVRALRQCDGVHSQAIVLARDDFWMPVTRFFAALDVRLEEGINSRPVDLFDRPHARRVLTEYGRAYGCLPVAHKDISAQQDEFLDHVIDGLQENGKVICVRLVLFAQMMRDRDWTRSMLREVGGPVGMVNRFLHDTFSAANAPPLYRKLEVPARAILKSLLPEAGSPLKGRMQTVAHLAEVSGLDAADFAEVIRVLDRELRLITPTTPAGTASLTESMTFTESSNFADQPRWYQLTHDFLVESLRAWLFQKQRETWSGRTQLRLTELAQLWHTRPETRFLPSAWEFASISLLIRRSEQSEPERQFLRHAARRHLVRWSATMALLVVVCLIGATVWQQFHLNRNRERASSVVTHLLGAPITDVPGILVELQRFGRLATSALHSVANDFADTPARRLRARLALLPEDDQQSEPLIDALLAADIDHLIVIRQSLMPFATSVQRRLWLTMLASDSDDRRVLRAAAALAAAGMDSTDKFDDFSNIGATNNLRSAKAVNSANWTRVAPRIAGALLREEVAFEGWTRELRPIRSALFAPLTSIFSSTDVSDRDLLDRAATALANYAADDSARLAELIQSATPSQFVLLSRVLENHRESIGPHLHRLLTRSLESDVRAAEYRPPPSAADLVKRIEESNGIIASQFAFCSSLPLPELKRLSAELAVLGYQPSIARPWGAADGLKIAVVWERTDHPSQFASDLTAEKLRELDQVHRRSGLVSADVCAYDAAGDSSPDHRRVAAVWRQPREDERETEMYVLVPEQRHQESWEPLNQRGFVPRTNQLSSGSGGPWYTSLRVRYATPPVYADTWNSESSNLDASQNSGWRQMDIRLTRDEMDPSKSECSSIWWNSGPDESQMVDALPLSEHLAKCRELTAKGFRMMSLSAGLAGVNATPIATSVWHRRPLTTKERDRATTQAVNVAIALLQMGDADPVRRLILDDDPSFRALFSERVANLRTAPHWLAQWLLREEDNRVRFTLLLGLARYHRDSVPSRIRDDVSYFARLQMRDSQASAVHAASQFLLQTWHDERAGTILRELPRQAMPKRDAEWFINGQGQTMIVFNTLPEFRMGSPVTELERSSIDEVPHRRRITRKFAIAMHEITAEQFSHFDPEFRCPVDYTPSRECPVNMVTWYDAARYCRWLSEREGISREEMCFPPISEIREGMTLPDDLLQRTGYRLPTEAEWEFACRAGTLSSRYFGESPTLGPRYGWNVDNAEYVLHPVGRLLPNDRGLFDMYGNAMEWTLTLRSEYPRNLAQNTLDDPGFHGPVTSQTPWITRGGGFLYAPSNGRSAQRHFAAPGNRYPHMSFRPVRTLRTETFSE